MRRTEKNPSQKPMKFCNKNWNFIKHFTNTIGLMFIEECEVDTRCSEFHVRNECIIIRVAENWEHAYMPFALCYSLYSVFGIWKYYCLLLLYVAVYGCGSFSMIACYVLQAMKPTHIAFITFNDHLANVCTVERLNECLPYGNMRLFKR